MKSIFEIPVVEVMLLDDHDVITTSPEGPGGEENHLYGNNETPDW